MWFARSSSRPFNISLTCLWSASIVMQSVTTPLDDPIQYSSTLLKVCVFSNHLLLDLIFPRYLSDETFHCRSFTTDRDSVHGRHDLLALDATVPHTWARGPSRQLESLSVDERSSSRFCAASRVPYKLYCDSPHMCSSPAW